ncbi:MAG: adenosylcobinamide-phosphate synthase CbiB [Chloroflexi bacterium]|nr:adenosylcobinamide-phosphate synthase CbiB [Chloroflexota bacterium]MDA1228074.1 adenosylcobinamide-phosphate synthase CbiB [Chloroflexota bacterium]
MDWLPWTGQWYLDGGVLLLALALDLGLREPPARLHPVVWIGNAISFLDSWLPQSSPAKSVTSGSIMAVCLPLVAGGLAWLAMLGLREIGPLAYVVGGAVLLKTTFAVKGLAQAAQATGEAMQAERLDDARDSLQSLVSRDAQALASPLVAAAAVESVAENTTDSYIGPWLAFALLGLPGAFAYRAMNTLDSMVGYRGRYEYFGKASAKLDDLVNLIPARISAGLILLAGSVRGLSVKSGWSVMISAQRLTASPNAGWTIGAMSGLLGVVLEKPDQYRIGEGNRDPDASDIGASVRLAYIVAALGIVLALGVLYVRGVLVY